MILLFTQAQRRDTQAWSVSYFGTSHLGTPEVAFEMSGEVTWRARARAQAFGERQITLNTIDNALRFPGQYFDTETGLYQNYFRDYDPRLGRYVQSDPIGVGGGMNYYLYVSARALILSDRYGLQECCGNEEALVACYEDSSGAFRECIELHRGTGDILIEFFCLVSGRFLKRLDSTGQVGIYCGMEKGNVLTAGAKFCEVGYIASIRRCDNAFLCDSEISREPVPGFR